VLRPLLDVFKYEEVLEGIAHEDELVRALLDPTAARHWRRFLANRLLCLHPPLSESSQIPFYAWLKRSFTALDAPEHLMACWCQELLLLFRSPSSTAPNNLRLDSLRAFAEACLIGGYIVEGILTLEKVLSLTPHNFELSETNRMMNSLISARHKFFMSDWKGSLGEYWEHKDDAEVDPPLHLLEDQCSQPRPHRAVRRANMLLQQSKLSSKR